MTEFNFLLSDRDTDLLFTLKQQQGLADLTGNEYARQLLEEALHQQARAMGTPKEGNP